MRTKLRRSLTGAALACAVGTSALAMTDSASADGNWRASVKHTVTTWHCKAQLIGEVAQSGSGPHVTTIYAVRGQLSSGKYYQTSFGPDCSAYIQLSKNGGKSWYRPDTPASIHGANQSVSTFMADDNAPLIGRVCISEQYSYWPSSDSYQTYKSGTRCTAGW
jgi:hypothetical protein